MSDIVCNCNNRDIITDKKNIVLNNEDKNFILVRQYLVRYEFCTDCHIIKRLISRYLIKDSCYYIIDSITAKKEIENVIKNYANIRSTLMKFKDQEYLKWASIIRKYPGNFLTIYNLLWKSGSLIYERKKTNKRLVLPEENNLIPNYLYDSPIYKHY